MIFNMTQDETGPSTQSQREKPCHERPTTSEYRVEVQKEKYNPHFLLEIPDPETLGEMRDAFSQGKFVPTTCLLAVMR
ncbi:hypothetical protein ACMFMF_003073 [Clarireedia jacksonii]